MLPVGRDVHIQRVCLRVYVLNNRQSGYVLKILATTEKALTFNKT
jgi:hypothetical protein